MGFFKKKKKQEKKQEIKKEEVVENNAVNSNQNQNQNQNKAKEQQAKTDDEIRLATNTIKVRVYKTGVGDINMADRFFATLRRTSANNIEAVSEDKNFREDLDFTRDSVYKLLNIQLGLEKETHEKKIEILKGRVRKQRELVKTIVSDVDKNKKYNEPDQRVLLTDLEILLEHTRRIRGFGTYYKTESGVKTYEFIVKDGVLVPYWQGISTNSAHPDLTVKKKIYVTEKQVFNAENNLKDKIWNWATVVAVIAIVVLLLGNGYWMFKNYKTAQEINMDLNSGAKMCADTCNQAVSKCALIKMGVNAQTTEKDIKNKNDNNIIVDPTGIIPGVN